SYAQTPAEHIAFQYIPSPSDAPPVPRIPTPIDPQSASIYTPQQQATQPQPQAGYSASAYPENVPVSPLSSNNRASTSQFASVSPVSEPQQVDTQHAGTHPSQHTRDFSNLSPINTNLGQRTMPPMPPTPHSHPAGELPQKMPPTPISPNSMRKEPLDHQPPTSPASKASYAHEPYSPHALSIPNTNTRHAVFSPDCAHGPNGLDFSLHRPGQIAHPNMDLSTSGAKQSWKTSLCSCTPDISTCLTGLACPCILYGRTSYRLSQKTAKQDPTDLLSHEATNGHCAIMALSCGLWWLFPMLQRTRIRHMYKLEGGLLGDCVKAACCCCCVAVQNEREVKSREEAMRRWAGPVSSEVYGREGGMKYKPQR
ncbi:PLAC8-domain-containing protein, partial [Byssothecium circinans]